MGEVQLGWNVIVRQEKMTNKAKSQMHKVRHEVKDINRKEQEKIN